MIGLRGKEVQVGRVPQVEKRPFKAANGLGKIPALAPEEPVNPASPEPL